MAGCSRPDGRCHRRHGARHRHRGQPHAVVRRDAYEFGILPGTDGSSVAHTVGTVTAADSEGHAVSYSLRSSDPPERMYMVGTDDNALHTLDRATGVATRVGDAVDFGAGVTDVQGLAWHGASSTWSVLVPVAVAVLAAVRVPAVPMSAVPMSAAAEALLPGGMMVFSRWTRRRGWPRRWRGCVISVWVIGC